VILLQLPVAVLWVVQQVQGEYEQVQVWVRDFDLVDCRFVVVQQVAGYSLIDCSLVDYRFVVVQQVAGYSLVDCSLVDCRFVVLEIP
jgi:hypothetical protein